MGSFTFLDRVGGGPGHTHDPDIGAIATKMLAAAGNWNDSAAATVRNMTATEADTFVTSPVDANGFTIQVDGNYLINIWGFMSSSGQRCAVNLGVRIAGSDAFLHTTYIRNANGINSENYSAVILRPLVAGNTIRMVTLREGGVTSAATVGTGVNAPRISILRLS